MNTSLDLMYPSLLKLLRFLGLAFLCTLLSFPVKAASSILIWPINPVIASDEKAQALWLRNQGTQPVTLQIRVLDWQQRALQDTYQSSSLVAPSPPFVTVEPGQRQLIRLTRTASGAAGYEHAFRILIDEIPDITEGAGQGNSAVRFRMRYSVPLFVYGQGLQPLAAASSQESVRDTLEWHIAQEQNGYFLRIHNSGPYHAKLSNVLLEDEPLAEGLLGYILPGQTMQWPLTTQSPAARRLTATINGNAPATLDQGSR